MADLSGSNLEENSPLLLPSDGEEDQKCDITCVFWCNLSVFTNDFTEVTGKCNKLEI